MELRDQTLNKHARDMANIFAVVFLIALFGAIAVAVTICWIAVASFWHLIWMLPLMFVVGAVVCLILIKKQIPSFPN